MTVYTVKSVWNNPREWTSKQGGTFMSYKVDLTEADGTVAMGVEWNKKVDSPAPQVGEQVAGHTEEGTYGPKFKIDYEATKELRGSGSPGSPRPSGGKSKEWQPESERDPERAARILRQHSQEMAIRALAAGLAVDGAADSPGLRWWIDWFDADVIEAGKKAAKQGTPEPQAGQQVTSPPSDSPASQAPSIQEMDEALSTAGLLTPSGRDMVTQYMVAQLSEDEIGRAVDRLVNGSDTAEQATTLDKLKKRTVQWSGKPLPQGDSLDGDDSIPF